MKRLFILYLGAFVPESTSASDAFQLRDIRSFALAEIVASLSSYSNPSALSLTPARTFSLSYENRFMTRELSTYAAAFSQPTPWVDLSVVVSRYGYEDYHETKCGLNVGKLLGNGFSLGVRFLFFNMDYVDNEDPVNVFSADVGLQYQPVDNLLLGVLVSNPFGITYKRSDERYDLPVTFSVGLRYTLIPQCNLWMEGEKSSDTPFCWKGAAEYEIMEALRLRLGILSSPWMPTFGVGYRMGKLSFDVAGAWHPVLGISPGIGISFTL